MIKTNGSDISGELSAEKNLSGGITPYFQEEVLKSNS
jgi:hypothetical protein